MKKSVAVIGGGIAGLTAAHELALFGYRVTLIEKAQNPGGHGARLSCKAIDRCVQCGACRIEKMLKAVYGHPGIEVLTDCRIEKITRTNRFNATLNANTSTVLAEFDAVVVATGFEAFVPTEKPYGYGHFANVVTSLELEQMLREKGKVVRPSDNTRPQKIAFVQCVGSRDASLNHLWCSRVCCASALRTAQLIQSKNPHTGITIFYQDIQSFGKDFQRTYDRLQHDLHMVRSLPGDIFAQPEGRLKVNFFDPQRKTIVEVLFDLVVLSIGLTPRADTDGLAGQLGLAEEYSDYANLKHQQQNFLKDGIFIAGTALMPMGISDAIRHATLAAYRTAKYLER